MRIRQDQPGGAKRLYATARGVVNVLVNGIETVRDGELTGASEGTLLRSGASVETVLP